MAPAYSKPVSFFDCILEKCREYWKQPNGQLKHQTAGPGPDLDPSVIHDIILYRGTFNPPHEAHKAAFFVAKQHSGLEISAALLLAKRDDWVRDKLSRKLEDGPQILFEKGARFDLWEEHNIADSWYRVVGDTDGIHWRIRKKLRKKGVRIRWVHIVGPEYLDEPNFMHEFGVYHEVLVCSNDSRQPFFDPDGGQPIKLEDALGEWELDVRAQSMNASAADDIKVWVTKMKGGGEARYIQFAGGPRREMSSTMIRKILKAEDKDAAARSPVKDMALNARKIALGLVKWTWYTGEGDNS
ncbi:uncharacterized protein AB675_8851 [Cyphellophora attinorum]|uniref:Cytidyltransferase-like domain-containing protein n=1 Tax=Cyphellophora attinorum TaxID=1664694 RepID=A0A0N0NJ41_9EURO|nr:uncharacterized protein AB675_8851 [Phialophora attinorum]KPI36169.1 hypothetical protein AB675_8851 [Phialophora attinorum]